MFLSRGVLSFVFNFVLFEAKGYEYVLEPSPVPLPLDKPQETRVLQVACGRAHSLVLTDKEGGAVTFWQLQGNGVL